MTARLSLLCCAATASAREGGFASETEPLDAPGKVRAQAYRIDGARPTQILAGPSAAARQTAAAIGWAATVEPALADMDWGEWSGRSFADIQAADPQALATWLANPAAGTPGGEGLAAVADRVKPWLARISVVDGRVLAVTHPMTIRAVLAAAIGMMPGPAMRIDIAPLSLVELSFNRIWRLQELRRP